MNLWGKHFSRLIRDEEGQGTVEYVLLLSAVVVGAIQLNKMFLKALDKGLLRIGGQLERDLKTGRAPPDVWSN